MTQRIAITILVNGIERQAWVEPKTLLVDFLREELGLTGTHAGCREGVCGACTVIVDGRAVRSCLMLAVQANGAGVTTIEGLARGLELDPLQRAFVEHGAIQCGFCTPGLILTSRAFLEENPHPNEKDIREAISGNICRCTGYVKVVAAIQAVAGERR